MNMLFRIAILQTILLLIIWLLLYVLPVKIKQSWRLFLFFPFFIASFMFFPFKVTVPVSIENNTEWNISQKQEESIHTQIPVSNSDKKDAYFDIKQIIEVCWFLGFILSSGIYGISYVLLHYKNDWKKQKQTSSYCLYTSKKCLSPFGTGIFHKKIIVPQTFLEADEKEQTILIQHELEHFKQYHFYLLFLHNIISCIYWFHPLVHINKRIIKEQMEYCVDECILKNKNQEECKEYGNYLIKYTLLQASHSLSFSSCKKMVKKRIQNLMEETSMKKTRKLFVVVLTCILTACASVQVKEEKPVKQAKVVEEVSDFKGAVKYLQSLHDKYKGSIDIHDVNEVSQCFHPRGTYLDGNGDKIEILSLPHPPYYYKVLVTQDQKQQTLYLPFDGKGVEDDFIVKVKEELKKYNLKEEY